MTPTEKQIIKAMADVAILLQEKIHSERNKRKENQG